MGAEMVFRMMSEFRVSFLPHLWGDHLLLNEGSYTHIFLATGCRKFFKAGSEHKRCNSYKEHVAAEVASDTQVAERLCVPNKFENGIRSRAAFLHRGVGLLVIVGQCVLEESICKSCPRLLVSCF